MVYIGMEKSSNNCVFHLVCFFLCGIERMSGYGANCLSVADVFEFTIGLDRVIGTRGSKDRGRIPQGDSKVVIHERQRKRAS